MLTNCFLFHSRYTNEQLCYLPVNTIIGKPKSDLLEKENGQGNADKSKNG